MGWSDCGVNHDTGAKMGYAHPGICDQEGCEKEIHHGLAYVCGYMHGGGEHGCGEYFCYYHLHIMEVGQLCEKCGDQFERALEVTA